MPARCNRTRAADRHSADTPSATPPLQQVLRRSERRRRAPAHHGNYVNSNQANINPHISVSSTQRQRPGQQQQQQQQQPSLQAVALFRAARTRRSVLGLLPASNFHGVVAQHNLGGFSNICAHCAAERFAGEAQSTCCMGGKVVVDLFPPPPQALMQLYSDPNFKRNVRAYNSAMSFVSVGAKVDRQLATGRNGVATYKVNGHMSHLIGSALPSPGHEPSFCQIYFSADPQAQSARRNAIFNDQLNPIHLGNLGRLLTQVNPYVQLFENSRDTIAALGADGTDVSDFRIHLRTSGNDQRRYNAPTCDEVGALLFQEDPEQSNSRDIIIRSRGDGTLKRISELDTAYDALAYPLLLPLGSHGWSPTLPPNN